MRAVGVEELTYLPFVRHQVNPGRVIDAWATGDAAAVRERRTTLAGTVTVVTCLGDRDTATLLAELAEGSAPPDRLAVTAPAAAIPAAWTLSEVRQWSWMWTTRRPEAPRADVENVADPAEVNAFLDAAAPESHVRPGVPGITAWLGLREDGRLVATGAALRQPDGTGHLRGIAVAPDRRGRGLGREISAALTRVAMGDTGVCSLGVYTDNAAAIRTYLGLGYDVVHTFTSGPVSGSSITTAAAPSR